MSTLDVLLCDGFKPPPLKDKIKSHNVDTICAVTGRPIDTGVMVEDIITDATNQPHETFKYHSDYVSVESARMFKWVIGGAVGNMFAMPGFAAKPMVSRDSAVKQDRPCWIDLVRGLKPGTKTVAIFSDESKRRLWAFTNVGIVGSSWQIFLNVGDISANVTVDHGRVLECLELLETLYNAGFSKAQMAESLYSLNHIKNHGYEFIGRYEGILSTWRNTPEFALSLFIVQKTEDNSDN